MDHQGPVRSSWLTISCRLGQMVRRVIAVVGRFLREDLPVHLKRIGLRDAETGDDLHRRFAARTADWVVMACFAFRVVATPFLLIGDLTALGHTAERFALVIGGLMLWNIFLAAAATRPRFRVFLSGRLFY